MQLCDVNVFVYAHRAESERHDEYRDVLARLLRGPSRYAVSELVLSGFLRVVTRAGLWESPTPLRVALAFADEVRSSPHAVVLRAGQRHWDLFDELLRTTETTGAAVTDAYHAALAIEHGAELLTADRGFARFPGLRWRHPLS